MSGHLDDCHRCSDYHPGLLEFVMIMIVLKIALCLVATSLCASRIGEAVSPPNPGTEGLFQALKMGVLVIRGDLCTAWISGLSSSPIQEFIERIEGVLLGELIPTSCCEAASLEPENGLMAMAKRRLEMLVSALDTNKTIKKQQLALAVAVSRQKDTELANSLKILTKFVVFQASLRDDFGTVGVRAVENVLLGVLESEQLLTRLWVFLGRHIESVIFKAVVPVLSKRERLLADFGRLISKLAGVKDGCDLFKVLTAEFATGGVSEAWQELNQQYPAVAIKLIMAHVRGGGHDLTIPDELISSSNSKGQYLLMTVLYKVVPAKRISGRMNWFDIYILSKCPEYPSEDVTRMCLQKWPEYFDYEGTKSEVGSLCLTLGAGFDISRLYADLLLEILRHLGLLSLTQTVPRVCRYWKEMSRYVLRHFPDVLRVFGEDLGDCRKLLQVPRFRCCLWRYSLDSHWDILEYLLFRRKYRIQGHTMIKAWIVATWKLLGQEISRDGRSVSPAKYVALYLDCCEAAERTLEFYQLPGMSDGEYILLVADIVALNGTMPVVSPRLLREECERFMQMVSNHTELLIRLFQKEPWICDGLIIRLFSSRTRIPPAVGAVLEKSTVLYGLLFGERDSIDGYLDGILQYFTEGRDQCVLAHNVINLCLLLRHEDSSETLKHVGKKLQSCYCAFADGDYVQDYSEINHSWKVGLGVCILTFLRENRKSYNSEELGIIERVLEQCGILDEATKQLVFESCASDFATDHRLYIHLVL